MPVIFRKVSSSDPLHVLADKLSPRLRRAFAAALKRLRNSVSLTQLEEAVRTGDVNAALALLAIDKKFTEALNGAGIETGIESFKQAIQETFEAGAIEAQGFLVPKIGLQLRFDLFNPETVKFLNDYAFSAIKQISENTREGIRDVLVEAFSSGGHPTEQARAIRGFIGLTANQSKAVLNYRRALSRQSTMRQALDRALRDGRFDATVQRAIRNNNTLTAAQINKMVDRYQQNFINYRATNIARSESIRASNKGQRSLWNQAREKGLIDARTKREWIASGDSDTCEDCQELDGTVAGLDEEFAPGISDPGDVHSSCRCSQALVFE